MGLFSKKRKETGCVIYSPLDGEVQSIDQAPDPVFSQKMMGDGIVIFPSNGKVVAPFDGKVTMIFPTKHAIGLVSNSGVELLIHYGLDTVNLQGKGFKVFVEENQSIQKGTLLLEADNDLIRASNYSTAVPVVFTAMSEQQSMEVLKTGQVTQGEEIIIIK